MGLPDLRTTARWCYGGTLPSVATSLVFRIRVSPLPLCLDIEEWVGETQFKLDFKRGYFIPWLADGLLTITPSV